MSDSASLPRLRRPTRRERLMFALTKRWPDSYVNARLNYADAVSRALAEMDPLDAMRALTNESPYETVRDV